MAIYRGLSPQARAVRGGISARTPIRRSAPITPRTIAPAHESVDDVIDMVPSARNVYRPAEGDYTDPGQFGPGYQPATPADARLDELVSPDPFDFTAGRALGAAARMGLAKYAGVPTSRLAEVGMSSFKPTPVGFGLGLLDVAKDAFGKARTRSGYRGLTDPIGTSELDRFNETRDFAKPGDVMAYDEAVGIPGEYSTGEIARHQLANMENMEALERTRGLSQLSSLFDDQKMTLSPVTIPPEELVRRTRQGEMSQYTGDVEDDFQAMLDANPGMEESYAELGINLDEGERPYTVLPPDFYDDLPPAVIKSQPTSQDLLSHRADNRFARDPEYQNELQRAFERTFGKIGWGGDMRGRDRGPSESGIGPGGTRGGGASAGFGDRSNPGII